MADKDFSVVAAISYVRKSTKGVRSDGRQRQERSLKLQREGVDKLQPPAGGKYQVVRRYEDAGKSGWKRGTARPGHAKILADCQQLKDVQAILVDNIDRFSRDTNLRVQADLSALVDAGVRWIHSAAQGIYDLAEQDDMGGIFKLTADIVGAHAFSRTLSRRVSVAGLDNAKAGKRNGAVAPYGLKRDPDRKGCLILGDPKQQEIVRRIFAEFAAGRSLHGILGGLNREGTPSSKGGRWHEQTIKELLQREAYIGTFVYGLRRCGRFTTLDDIGEVVKADPAAWPAWRAKDDGGVQRHKNKWPALIDTVTWSKVQKRLQSAEFKGRRGQRENGYPLSGVLHCGHCGGRLYGTTRNGRTIYRCGTVASRGRGACGYNEVREQAILPRVLQMLGEEIEGLSTLAPAVPSMPPPAAEKLAELERQAAALKTKISRGEESLFECEDKRNRQAWDKRLSEWRDELEAVERAMESVGDNTEETIHGLRIEQAIWLRDFWRTALHIPVADAALSTAEAVGSKAWRAAGSVALNPLRSCTDGSWSLMAEPLAVNQALRQLGCKVTLRWTREMEPGRQRARLRLSQGCRIQLGQKTAALQQHVLSGMAHAS